MLPQKDEGLSLLGLQLGGGKVSRMKEWECKQTAHSTGSCWQQKGFPGKGRENEGLQRKAKRKPHVVLFQKRTLRSDLPHRYNGLCCQQQELLPSCTAQSILMLVGKCRPTSPPAQTLRGESILCWCSYKGVFSSREGSWGSINKTKLHLSGQRVRKKVILCCNTDKAKSQEYSSQC